MSEISKIDAVLSVCFDECSIAAADAAREAEQRFQNPVARHETRVMRSIGRFSANQQESFDLLHVTDTVIDDPLFCDNKVTLALAKHSYIEDFPVSLVALINANALLPIATFEQRSNGQCSYVQIGQEIDDDTLVATTQSTRSEEVEAIRAAVKEGAVSPLLQTIIKNEASTYNCEIERALEPEVVEAANRYFNSSKRTKRAIHVINEKTDTTEKLEVESAPITCISNNIADNTISGHDVELFLGKEVKTVQRPVEKRKRLTRLRLGDEAEPTDDDSLSLYAQLRGGVTLKLASFMGKPEGDGTVCLQDFDVMPNTSSLTSLLSVFQTPDKERQATAKAKREVTKYYFPDAVAMVIKDSNHSSGAYFSYLTRNQLRSHYNNISISSVSTWKQLNDVIDYYRERNNIGRQVEKEVCEYLGGKADSAMIALIDALRLPGQLNARFDHGESAHEQLVTAALGLIATGTEVEMSTVLPNHTVGKTKTDVVTKVQLSRTNDNLNIRVSGRPIALEGFDMATLFDTTLDLGSKNDEALDKSEAIEITKVLAQAQKSNA